MAINKSHTSPLMKTLIILLAASFVIGIGGLSVLSTCSTNAPLLPGGTATTTTATVDTTAAILAINAKDSPEIQAREASITADPKNYALLIAQANAYYDWASDVLQTAKQHTSADLPLWADAVSYFERALALKPGDPSVMTDYSIAVFYSGDAKKAITVALQVVKANPKFAPAAFNLGIFYANTGVASDALKAEQQLQEYLKLEPTGQDATAAKQILSELASQAASGTTPPGSGSTNGTSTAP